MTKWEYKLIAFNIGILHTNVTKNEEMLNKLGEEGWELTSISLGQKFIFKREKK